MIQIELEADIPCDAGKTDEDVCLRTVSVRLSLPLYAKRHDWVSFMAHEEDIDGLLAAAGRWLKARRFPPKKKAA